MNLQVGGTLQCPDNFQLTGKPKVGVLFGSCQLREVYIASCVSYSFLKSQRI